MTARMKSLATLLTGAAGNPAFMTLMRELDEAEARARAVGLHDRFRDNWAYEVERARTTPSRSLSPKAVLQITISQKVPE